MTENADKIIRQLRRQERLRERRGTNETPEELLRRHGSAGVEYGQINEYIVASILQELPEVAKVEYTPIHGEEDKQGKDIIVFLQGQDNATVESVFIQVKSSRKELSRFRQKIRSFYGVENFEQWSAENRFILINAARPKEKIIEAFQTQLTAIQTYHAKHS